ncbi:FAD binding domain-containing protein [Bradyrhizobium sp. CCGB12]|uniref:FAD binding domain-containing protein n=1 Tax=Bradyrhizobium sp. CCGB12 TaxID=2949632 RepID=UPI0020B3AA33|nr:FAD binding domain-containing protein [Bradyrhizobium sp. CCGB12]MCP3395321.1 FAD binding domain-containing protein [Bradyrhizobium sp. CCGB12]
MKPAPFAYHRATSIEDAIAQLNDDETIARPLAGGQSLVPMLNLRLAPVQKLVDLGRIETLRRVDEQAGRIAYGALLPHAAFEDGRVPDGSNGLMSFIGGQIAYRAVRTRGTIGGALALADPAADWLTTVIALDGQVVLVGPRGRRSLAAADFVTGPYMTALDQAELLESVVIPRRAKTERWGHYKVTRKTGEYADSMAIALFDPDARKARIVVGAVNGAPIVLTKTALEIGEGANEERLQAAIGQELAESDRAFSPAKLKLHVTAALRAIRKAGLS